MIKRNVCVTATFKVQRLKAKQLWEVLLTEDVCACQSKWNIFTSTTTAYISHETRRHVQKSIYIVYFQAAPGTCQTNLNTAQDILLY